MERTSIRGKCCSSPVLEISSDKYGLTIKIDRSIIKKQIQVTTYNKIGQGNYGAGGFVNIQVSKFPIRVRGNVLIGGGIGIIVDAASGAAQEYPSEISIWMEPVKFATAQDKADWNAEKAAYEEAMKPKVPQSNNDNTVKSTSNINTK